MPPPSPHPAIKPDPGHMELRSRTPALVKKEKSNGAVDLSSLSRKQREKMSREEENKEQVIWQRAYGARKKADVEAKAEVQVGSEGENEEDLEEGEAWDGEGGIKSMELGSSIPPLFPLLQNVKREEVDGTEPPLHRVKDLSISARLPRPIHKRDREGARKEERREMDMERLKARREQEKAASLAGCSTQASGDGATEMDKKEADEDEEDEEDEEGEGAIDSTDASISARSTRKRDRDRARKDELNRRKRAARAEKKAVEQTGEGKEEDDLSYDGGEDSSESDVRQSNAARIRICWKIGEIQRRIQAFATWKRELEKKEKKWEMVERGWEVAQEKYAEGAMSHAEWGEKGLKWHAVGVQALWLLEEKREREMKLMEGIENSFIAQAHGVLDARENDDGPVGSVLVGFENCSEYCRTHGRGSKSEEQREEERQALMDSLCGFWVDAPGGKVEEFQELTEKLNKRSDVEVGSL